MAKISKIFETISVNFFSDLESLLMEGDLENAERQLGSKLQEVHEEILANLLTKIGTSKEFKDRLLSTYEDQGVRNLEQKETRIQLSTGGWVTYRSYYARKVNSRNDLPTRHLSQIYFGCIKGASPQYYSLLSAYSVMCPSFSVGSQMLNLHFIDVNVSRMRELSLKVGKKGEEIGVSALLSERESLKGKRVVVSFDGGRSRMRQSNGIYNRKGNAKYDTPWREPKIIVIHVLNESGELERKKSLPFYYGTLKSTKKAMNKLKEALILLEADQASVVQFIADGALSIWRNIRGVLKSVGIVFSKVVFTLDYYHAVEHLKGLSKLLPYEENKQNVAFSEWKEMLWEGLANSIARDFKKKMRVEKMTLTNEMKTAINYFTKHHDRMQYKKLKRRKLLSGSGLVESAVRRIINLRFKGPSTFWKEKNLEKLILLRCAFLAGRWGNLLKNIQLSVKNLNTI